MRLFVGIPLSAEVTEELARVCSWLRRADDGLRWSDAETWHITLQFLGSTSAEQYECVEEALRDMRALAVPVQLDGLGFFDRAGVFFASVVVSNELAALQQRVVAATSRCGFKTEERPCHPHITLARNKGRENRIRTLKAQEFSKPQFSGFVAREFLLYESFLGPTGSRYEVRERFDLRG